MVGALNDFRISLDFIGDAVVPDEISQMLGSEPTTAHKMGDPIHGADGTFRRNAKSGRWTISVTSRGEENPDFEQSLRRILDLLTDDLDVWRELSHRFNAELFCGIFLTDSNRGFTLSSDLLAELGKRHIQLGLDLYGPDLPQELEWPPDNNSLNRAPCFGQWDGQSNHGTRLTKTLSGY